MTSLSKKHEALVKVLQSGGVAVIPTDTIYGLVGSALQPKTVKKIYTIRKRNLKKPLIVLIRSMHDLGKFSITIDIQTKKILEIIWPGKISVVLPVRARKFSYLHRSTKTIAFRVPRTKWLRELLKKTGPLVAPSANPEGKAPAKTIREAKKYFGKNVGSYISGNIRATQASTLVKIERGRVMVLREGAVRVPKFL